MLAEMQTWQPRMKLYFMELVEEQSVVGLRHNENTPIQIYRKFYLQKLKLFR